MTETITFYFDVVCPYAYMASRRIDAFAERHGANVRWVPILLGGLFRSVGAPQRPAEVMSPARRRLNRLDIVRMADLWGIPLEYPEAHPRRTVDAMRLVVGAPADRQRAVSDALFEAYWVRGRDVADGRVLAEVAHEAGVDPAVVGSREARQALFANTDAAARVGAFGVPSFVAGDRLVWGQDRLHVLAHALGGSPEDPAQPHVDVRCVHDERVDIRFFHDFSSPFSYLASTQIERVARCGGATVQAVPILLGALFRDIGTPDVPMFAMSPAKQAWVSRDLEDWAQLWGVPFRFRSHFPVRTVLPLRAAIAEPRATAPIYRATWVDDVRVDDREALAGVLEAAGLDGRDVLAKAESDPVKAELRQNTEAARLAGSCGVPTFELRRAGAAPLVVWGQDRLGMVASALAGWWPRA